MSEHDVINVISQKNYIAHMGEFDDMIVKTQPNLPAWLRDTPRKKALQLVSKKKVTAAQARARFYSLTRADYSEDRESAERLQNEDNRQWASALSYVGEVNRSKDHREDKSSLADHRFKTPNVPTKHDSSRRAYYYYLLRGIARMVTFAAPSRRSLSRGSDFVAEAHDGGLSEKPREFIPGKVFIADHANSNDPDLRVRTMSLQDLFMVRGSPAAIYEYGYYGTLTAASIDHLLLSKDFAQTFKDAWVKVFGRIPCYLWISADALSSEWVPGAAGSNAPMDKGKRDNFCAEGEAYSRFAKFLCRDGNVPEIAAAAAIKCFNFLLLDGDPEEISLSSKYPESCPDRILKGNNLQSFIADPDPQVLFLHDHSPFPGNIRTTVTRRGVQAKENVIVNAFEEIQRNEIDKLVALVPESHERPLRDLYQYAVNGIDKGVWLWRSARDLIDYPSMS